MNDAKAWGLGTVGGLAVLGASAGVALGELTTAGLATLLFVSTFLGAGLSTQLYRRGHVGATLIAGLAADLGVFAFLAVAILRAYAPDARGVMLLLVVAPLVAASMAALGSIYLQMGVDRYRARHGLAHAPR